MDNIDLLGSRKLPNLLRFLCKVTGKKVKKVSRVLDKYYSMMTRWSYYAKKISRCSRKYPFACFVVWASEIYSVSYKCAFERKLYSQFVMLPKQKVEAVGLDYICETVEDVRPKEGYHDVYKCKLALLKKGYYYRDQFYFVCDGKLNTASKMNYASRMNFKVNVVPISVLRDLEMLWYGQITACTYESGYGGSVVYDHSDFRVFERSITYNFGGGLPPDYYIGDFSDLSSCYDHLHQMFLNAQVTIQFGKTFQIDQWVNVEVFRFNENKSEIVFGPYYTKIMNRNGFETYKLSMYRQRELVIDIPMFSDGSYYGKYFVRIRNMSGRPFTNTFTVVVSYYVVGTTFCVNGDDKSYMKCSCGKFLRSLQCECSDICVPFTVKRCDNCIRNNLGVMLKEISRVRKPYYIDKIVNKHTSVENMDIKEFADCVARQAVMTRFLQALNDKYGLEFFQSRDRPWELSARFVDCFFLDEMDYVLFLVTYEKLFGPADSSRFQITSDLINKRRWCCFPSIFMDKIYNGKLMYCWEN